MKRRFLQITTLLLAVVFTAMCFTACGLQTTTPSVFSVKLSSISRTYVVITVEKADGKATVIDALTSLEEVGKLNFTSEDSGYGAFITSINGKENVVTESTVNSSKGSSWMLYTSDKEIAYEETTTVVEKVTYYSSSVGASSLVLKADQVYVFVYEEYDYTW